MMGETSAVIAATLVTLVYNIIAVWFITVIPNGGDMVNAVLFSAIVIGTPLVWIGTLLNVAR